MQNEYDYYRVVMEQLLLLRLSFSLGRLIQYILL